MLEDLNTWKSSFAGAIGIAPDPATGATSLGNWLNARLFGKLDLNGVTPPGPLAMTFTFNTAALITALSAAVPTTSAQVGAAFLAGAIQTALTASVPATLPGTIIPPPTPATTFSSVTTTIIDAPTLVLAHDKVAEIADVDPNDPKVSSAADAPIVPLLREAVLLLTITTTGLNSVAPTPGALIDAGRAVQ